VIDAAIQQALEDGNCLQVESTSSQVNQFSWRSYYHGNEDELRLSRAFSFSDRCRYYWPQSSVQEEVKRLLQNLGRFSCPLTLLSQYLPIEYEAIREGALENDAAAMIGHHIRRVLRFYGAACGAPAS
jgi:D-tagatose-1,6-bisphosphate aldolase subunit GatZ/KbaZ